MNAFMPEVCLAQRALRPACVPFGCQTREFPGLAGSLIMSTNLTAGMQRYYAKGRLMLWSAAGLEVPLLLAAIANFIWVLVVETSSAGDAWWIAVLIVLPVLAFLLAAATSLQLALSVAYFSQAQAMQRHADSLRRCLNQKKLGTG